MRPGVQLPFIPYFLVKIFHFLPSNLFSTYFQHQKVSIMISLFSHQNNEWPQGSYQTHIQQYCMTSKAIRKVPATTINAFRQTGPIKNSHDRLREDYSLNEMVPESSQHDFMERKEQQIKDKIEKESTAALNANAPLLMYLSEGPRRSTRNSSNTCKKLYVQFDVQNEFLTPEDNPINKHTEDDTLKKMVQATSVLSLSDACFQDANLTMRKAVSRVSESQLSPYSEIRKSYRKTHKRQVTAIPYRKCQDALEGRVVSIINKMESNKNYQKEIECFVEKLPKISIKDCMNKHVVSGIIVILNLYRDSKASNPQLIQQLEHSITCLRERILQELTNFQSQCCIPRHSQQSFDYREYRHHIIRKLYKVLKKHNPAKSKEEIRQKTIQECDSLLKYDVSLRGLIKFMRCQMELRRLN